MRGRTLLHAIRWNLHALFQWQRLLVTTGLFTAIAIWNCYRVASAQGTALDVVYLTFGGFVQISVMDGAMWLLLHSLPAYFLGDLVGEALAEHASILLPRIGSRQAWWTGKVVIVLIVSSVYFLWGLLVVAGVAYLYVPGGGHVFALGLVGAQSQDWLSTLLWMYTLQALTASSLLTVLLAQSIYWMRTYPAFMLVNLINIASAAAAAGPSWLHRLLPGTQSMFALHAPVVTGAHGFTLLWSVGYNVALWLLAVWYGGRLLTLRDFAGGRD